MALSAKINGVTYRCVNDYSIKEQSGAVSTTSINVLLGANPVPLMLQQVQLYIDGSLFFAGLVQSVGTPEYSTTYETQVFSLSVSSLEVLFNMRIVTKNFYYYTYPSWTSVLNYIFTNYIAEEGITLGGISTTAKTFDSKYSVQNKKLSDVLNEIANAIGNATWKITPDRKFYFLISSDFPSVSVPSKLSKVQLSENLGDLRTVQTVIGASNGISATAENSTLKATIAARTGGSGKIEIVETDSSIHSDAKAATEAADKLTVYAEPIKEVSLLCHDLAASTLLNSWPLSLSIGGVAISGDFVVVERTISHQVGSKLNIQAKLKNNNFFARYGYTLKGAALLASESQGAIGDQNADNRLTPLEKKSLLEEWDTIAGEKAGLDSDGARYGLTSLVSTYDTSFQALADYLNDGTTWTSDTPLWLDGERMTQTEEIDYTVLASLKIAYYNARAALTNAIRSGATTRLSVSTSAIARARDDTLTPSSVTMSAADETGAAYLGRFKVEVYTSSWNTVYSSAADESSYAYTVPATYGGEYVSSVRVTLYAAGLGAKLGEALVTVALDSSTSAIYWGSFDDSGDWPAASQELGDYLWDNRTSAGGGGVIRYWDGAAWVEMTSAYIGYTQALWQALPEMGAWATAQGEVIAAASAIFNKLVTADAFIANLFAQQITIPDGGRMRYETGTGVQKRCVQLADEKIDWLDTPITSPASPEQLRARIGRLGVGGMILMDGNFEAPIIANFTVGVQKSTDTIYYPTVMKRKNGNTYIVLSNVTLGGGLYWASYNESTGALGSFLQIAPDGGPNDYIEDSSGNLRVLYTRWGSDAFLCEKVYNEATSTWGTEKVVLASSGANSPRYGLQGSQLYIAYGVYAATASYVWRTWDGTTLGSASNIVSSLALNTGITPNCFVHTDPLDRLWFYYHNTADGKIYRKLYNGGTSWGAAESIASEGTTTNYCYNPNANNLLDDTEIVVYQQAGVGARYRIIDNATVGSATTAYDSAYTDAYANQLYSGVVLMAYTSGNKLFISTMQRYAQVGAGIIESGYVSGRGWYIKYGDGTMECWIKRNEVSNITIGPADGFYYAIESWTFPVAFYTNPVVVGSNRGNGTLIFWNINAASISVCDYFAFCTRALASHSVNVYMKAIGKWKA